MSVAALNETIVFDLLRKRLTKPGNGGAGEYALLDQVRNDSGFYATRTFDAMAVSLWPSRGHTFDIYEIKVSRSDWQRELNKPDKAEDACKIADRFWIIAPAGCVRDGELPPTWGLLEITGDGDDKPWKLRLAKQAPLLTKAKPGPVHRGLVVAMLRSCPGAIPGGKVPAPTDVAIQLARDEGIEEGKRQAERTLRYKIEQAERNATELEKVTDALQEAGASKTDIATWNLVRRANEIVAALGTGPTVDIVSRLHDDIDRLLAVIDATGRKDTP